MKHDVSETAQLPSSGKEAPNIVDSLNRAQLLKTTRFIGPTRFGTSLHENGGRASFRNVVFQ